MNTHRATLKIAVAAVSLLFLTLSGCNLAGGGGSSSGGTDVVMSGTMTKGSVILNGVRFDDTTAGITADESAITAADLDDGMTVKLKGTIDAGGQTGEAELVEVENELKGSIDSIDPSTDFVRRARADAYSWTRQRCSRTSRTWPGSRPMIRSKSTDSAVRPGSAPPGWSSLGRHRAKTKSAG